MAGAPLSLNFKLLFPFAGHGPSSFFREASRDAYQSRLTASFTSTQTRLRRDGNESTPWLPFAARGGRPLSPIRYASMGGQSQTLNELLGVTGYFSK